MSRVRGKFPVVTLPVELRLAGLALCSYLEGNEAVLIGGVGVATFGAAGERLSSLV
jgi:hypothetical protein